MTKKKIKLMKTEISVGLFPVLSSFLKNISQKLETVIRPIAYQSRKIEPLKYKYEGHVSHEDCLCKKYHGKKLCPTDSGRVWNCKCLSEKLAERKHQNMNLGIIYI